MIVFPSRIGRHIGLVCSLLGLAFAPRAAKAQAGPLSSVNQPGAGIADGAEPWSVVLNPAALGTARDWLFGFRHTELTAGTNQPLLGAPAGRGSGLYIARPLPYLRNFVVGGGLELLRPGLAGLPDLGGKLTLGLGYRVGPLSLGMSYAHLFSRSTSPSYDGMDTLSLGLRVTAGRFFAAGLVLHDLPAPRPRDQAVIGALRSYELELLLRPLSDHRLELAGGVRVFEESHVLWPRLRLWARPYSGLGIGVESSLALTAPLMNAGGAPALDYRIGVGLSIDFAHVGASGFALFGNGQGSPSAVGLSGGSVAVRASFERYAPIWSGSGRVYRIELANRRGESMLRLLSELRSLERDKRARGVVLVVNGYTAGWGVADELRQAIVRLRAAGRRVIAYGADLSEREYYIASAAERIYLDPIGSVRLAGVSNSGYFVKEALDRLGVRADLIRIGEYKSTPEMWTRSEPSPPARQQRQALLDDLFERLCSAVATGRKLPLQRVTQLVERGLFTAQLATQAGLVDAVANGEEVENHLTALFGEPVALATIDQSAEHPTSYAPPGVAVINIEGDIAEGRSRSVPFVDLRLAGGQTLLETLYDVGRDAQIRAVVLRIDSPGGSALVSDLLARQVAALARVKPVICSFGDIAASGGYYVAAPCSAIFTNPSTTTGSIGIFGGKVDLSGLLGWLGVRRFTLQNGSHADLESPFRPYSDVERALVFERLRQGYDRFLEIVMNGRRFSRQEAEARAQGRLWSGSQAVAQKLADQTGGLMDAVAEARRRAGLSSDGEGNGPLFFYPRSQGSLLGRLLGLPDLLEGVSASTPSDLGRLMQAAAELLPGLRTAFLLLETDLLMRFDGEPPR